MATVEEICEGVICALEKSASRFLSGVAGNVEGGITINPDGSIEVGGGTLPTDDPDTIIDETEAARFGGTVSISKAIELAFDKLDTYYGTTNGTPTTLEANAQSFMKLFFDCDATLMDAAVTAYYAYRVANNRLLFDATQAIELYLFCRGSNERAFNQWLVDVSGYALAKIELMSEILAAMNQGFWDDYFEQGLSKPSTVYLEAACVPSPTEEIQITTLATTFTTLTAWKANHRLLWTVEGYFTDTDGDLLDFWYYDAAAASPISRISVVNIQLGSGITKPTTTQVPFSATHKYQFTIDTVTAGQCQITVPSTSMGTPTTTTNGFKVTIEDLGEIFL